MLEEGAAVSCPICLVSSADDAPVSACTSPHERFEGSASGDAVAFVKTTCGHIFCGPCIERVLLRPRHDSGIPTRAPCPMCREMVNLFELSRVNSAGEVDSSRVTTNGTLSICEVETDVSSWSIANSQFQQRAMRGTQNIMAILQGFIDRQGPIEGHGIKFCFQEPTPSMEFAKPLVTDRDDGNTVATLNSIPFDASHFHQRSMTFHGKVSFPNQIRDGINSYFYDEMDCLLNFSDDSRYIRKMNLRWKFASTPVEAYPLDGSWEVQYTHGETVVIFVQKHYFTCFGISYNLSIDPITHCPRFSWNEGSVEQTSVHRILTGTAGPGVGEGLEWTTSEVGHERIVWKRLATNIGKCWRPVNATAGNFVYRRCSEQQTGDENSLGPTYCADTLWGNTFCQAFCVGLASYHFLKPESSGESPGVSYQAYISYESPQTEMWPPLDNGETVPSRVPFRNIQWDPEMSTFKGDICWEGDYGTTWMNDSKWEYEIKFDPSFTFVVSGTVGRFMGEVQQFGRDLIYINAALELTLREMLQTSQSPGEYLDVIRNWRDNNASTGTLEMLGEVAMSVMGGRESLFDFNL